MTSYVNMREYKHKFKAKPVNIAGAHFDSKLEFKYGLYLDLLKRNGEILFYLRQTPIHLPGGTRYIADYLIFWASGQVDFVDVKGLETDLFKVKKREIEATYPFEIKVVRRGDF